MNIVKVLRISSMRSILNPTSQNFVAVGPNSSTNLSIRTLWHMCSSSSANNQILMTKSHSLTYSCCIHDQEVPSKGLDYSNDEISTREHEPEELDGFKIEAKGSKLELSKMFGNDESVKIYFNVNHTVKLCEHNRRDYDDEMRYKPTTFKIELIKGDRILDLKCSFNHPIDDCNGHPFKIDDIGLYVGEQKIKIEIHADSRNNLTREGSEQQAKLLKMLNDKGLDFEFARKLYHLVIEYERKPDM